MKLLTQLNKVNQLLNGTNMIVYYYEDNKKYYLLKKTNRYGYDIVYSHEKLSNVITYILQLLDLE